MRRVGFKPRRDNFNEDKKVIDEAFRNLQMRRVMLERPRSLDTDIRPDWKETL